MKLSGHKSNLHERYTHHELEGLRTHIEKVPSFVKPVENRELSLLDQHSITMAKVGEFQQTRTWKRWCRGEKRCCVIDLEAEYF
jgi:hypothetical protein